MLIYGFQSNISGLAYILTVQNIIKYNFKGEYFFYITLPMVHGYNTLRCRNGYYSPYSLKTICSPLNFFLWQWLLHLFVCITQRLQILQEIWLVFIQICVVVGTSAQIMVTLYFNLNQTYILILFISVQSIYFPAYILSWLLCNM